MKMADDNSEKPDYPRPRLQVERKNYKGVCMFVNEIEEIEKMDTRKEDIWICTYPRSGTTMTQEMVYLIQTLDFETASKLQLDERVPYLEIKDDRWPYYKGLKYVEQLKSPRIIKTHLHHFMLPEQLQNGKGRIIYLVRNPKDVVTSFYRFFDWADQLVEGDRSFQKFFDGFVNGTEFACPWPRHVLEYWKRKEDPNVLFLRFEDVVKDKPAAIRQVADFLGRTLTNDEVRKVNEHIDVDFMRNNDKVNWSYWKKIRYVNENAQGAHINKGQPGAWHDVLTPEQSARIDGMLHELDGSGLEIVQT